MIECCFFLLDKVDLLTKFCRCGCVNALAQLREAASLVALSTLEDVRRRVLAVVELVVGQLYCAAADDDSGLIVLHVVEALKFEIRNQFFFKNQTTISPIFFRKNNNYFLIALFALALLVRC